MRDSNQQNRLGLYWKDKRTEVEKVSLPFQVVETVNESKADRERLQQVIFKSKDAGTYLLPSLESRQLDLTTGTKLPKLWRNKLIWGDNKYIMSSLLNEFAGKINLIYIDPPFATGSDFSIHIKLGDLEWTKSASVIEEKAYRDTWGKGLDSYLQMIYGRLVLMRELLSDNGSIYVHLDWHVGHYVKVIMDEIFGKENFGNEIIWRREVARGRKAEAKYMGHNTDHIMLYVKNRNAAVWNRIEGEKPISRQEIEKDFMKDSFGYFTTSHKGTYSDKFIVKLEKENRIFVTRGGELVVDKNGKVSTTKGTIRIKYYLLKNGNEYVKTYNVDNLWTDIRGIAEVSPQERVNFPTQKPEKLVERIIKASSNEGDIVADFFCGSGTTGTVAEKLGRRWIISDLSKFAIHTTRKRLLNIQDCKPFEVLNLGQYQRHKLKENGDKLGVRYYKFILDLYRGEALPGFTRIHGKKAGRMVHIGGVDSMITEREIRDVVNECKEVGAKAIDILGWDFEMGLHDLVDIIGDEYGVKIRLVQIPREALEVKSPAREEIKFFDLNYLELSYEIKGNKVTVMLKDFTIANPEYLPEDVRDKIEKFTDLIDYWAVDFEYKNDTFHNMWQSFRTKKHPKLSTEAHYTYENKSKYQVLVKVVDIFGNDTNKIIEIEI